MGMFMRRRPLLRAAAVGGGAYAMGKRRAAAEAQDQTMAPAPAPPPVAPQAGGGMSPDVISQLKDLGQLHDQGVLTDEEFAAQKAKLLG